MSRPASDPGERAATADLVAALEPALGRIARLDRRASAYSSSFALEELDVQLAGGPALALVFKDLGREGLLRGARAAKPDFLYEPRREIDTSSAETGSSQIMSEGLTARARAIPTR